MPWIIRVWISLVLLAALLALASVAGAHTHDGEAVAYPPDCCGGNDCAPILASRLMPDGRLWVRTEHGETYFPAGHEWREFESTRSHACFMSFKDDAGNDAGTVHYCLLGKSGI